MRRPFAIFGLTALFSSARAYSSPPRWAQAVAVSSDVLFLYGGMSDPSNQFSYTSAPWTNDLLYLSLSSSWDPSNAPWNLIGGSNNASSAAQGTALAWHSLSTYASGQLLLFGGNTGPLSDVVLLRRNDSAALVDVYNRIQPTINNESASWAGEPLRRMRHATVTSGGKVYIIGGELADGSGNALSDHYVFDPSGPSFSPLPTSGAPPDIYGHAAIVLLDGRIIVFGGFSQSGGGLVSFSQAWIFDPKTNSWSGMSIGGSGLVVPTSRIGFCSTLLADGRILIHGGSDAGFQNTHEDGWILDTMQNPMTWSTVAALSQLGQRKDHFCVSVGNEVIFGFGYGNSGPVGPALQIYDFGSGSFVPSFTPPSPTASPSLTTIPPPSATGGGGGGGGGGQSVSGTAGSGSSVSGPGPAGTGSNYPTGSTLPPGVPSPTSTGTPQNSGSQSNGTHVALIVGAVFGAVALIIAALVIAFYIRRRDSESMFSRLDGEDSPGGSGSRAPSGIPVLQDPQSIGREKGSRLGGMLGLSTAAGLFGLGAETARRGERRDMLADEDRSFDWESGRWSSSGRWSTGRRGGSNHPSRATSTWSASASSLSSRLSGAVAGSLRVLGIAGGSRRGSSRRAQSREASGADWEKFGDPFADEVALMHDEAERPRGGTMDPGPSAYPYTDPFADVDPDAVVLHDVGGGGDSDTEESSHEERVRVAPPHPALRTALPPTADFVPMSPLIEQASRASYTSSSQAHSSSNAQSVSSPSRPSLGPYDTVSSGSHSHSHTHSPRPSSILDAQSPTSVSGIKRSGSWWARLTDPMRRVADAGPSRFVDDFRDPNPPPARLRPIEESQHSPEGASTNRNPSAGSAASKAGPGAGSADYAYAVRMPRSGHGKSMSSLQTANSETIERVGGMAVVQREGTYDSNASTSPRTDEFGFGRPTLTLATRGMSAASVESDGYQAAVGRDHTRTPTGETALETTVESIHDLPPAVVPPSGPRQPGEASRTLSPGSVAERVKLYERRMSTDVEPMPMSAPTPTKARASVQYGLAPRAPLFVANPDASASTSKLPSS